MEYEPLSKIFYSNPKSYKSTFESRFNNPNTIHFDFCINDNPAFLVLDPSIYSNLADIYRKDKEVLIKTKQLPGKAIGQSALLFAFFAQTAVLSKRGLRRRFFRL